jgi:hypothetical protein
MKLHGKFDDVVLDYLNENDRKSQIFLQLNSKLGQEITLQQLFAEKGNFSLRKYCETYTELEKFSCSNGVKKTSMADEHMFIIYTNATFDQKLKCTKVTDFSRAEFLMTGTSVLQFNEEEHKAIYEHLHHLPKHREFLSRLWIFYSQANEEEMDWHIKRELQQSMKIPENELDLTYKVFLPIIQNWWQNNNYFLKETNSNEQDPLQQTSEKVIPALLANALDQRKLELEELCVKYKQSAIVDMKQQTESNKAILIFAPGHSTTLTAAKIHQMLSARKHIILNLQQLIRYNTEVVIAWKNRFDILVLESQSSTENSQDILNDISKFLNECGEEKQFIFIDKGTGTTEHIRALRGTLKEKLTEVYDDWKFTDIFTDSAKFLLEKMVTFQGKELQIKNLVKESDFRILNTLDCDSLSLLLANEKPSIGTPTENKLQNYIERTLVNETHIDIGTQTEGETGDQYRKESVEEQQVPSSYVEDEGDVSDSGPGVAQFLFAEENNKETVKGCSETHKQQTLCTTDKRFLSKQISNKFSKVERSLQRNDSKGWRPSTLLDGKERIILVADDQGTGKSTLLTHLEKQTQERHPDVWVVRVNINNYTRILQEIKRNGFFENGAIKIITEAARIKITEGAQLEGKLFNYIYKSTGNMVVLIDGVDEVSPQYTEEVIQILRILVKTEIRKIWVTSRNSEKDHLELELQCQSYRLVPFSVEDQKSF